MSFISPYPLSFSARFHPPPLPKSLTCVTSLATWWPHSSYSSLHSFGKKIFHSRPDEAALLDLSGVYSNIGFMGVPVLLAVLGDESAIPLVLARAMDVLIIVPTIPIAVVAFVFSQQVDVYAEATSAAILVSTIISVITVPPLLHLTRIAKNP